jgi:steroid 5-alpha reductase family enzyme
MWYQVPPAEAPVVFSILIAVLTLFVMLWLASLALKDASIVDRFWGISFLVIASAASAAGDGYETRARLVVLLVAIWGLRLSFHITVRGLGSGEDFRYRSMRRQWGKQFPLTSLFTVFLLQGLLAWVVSLPVQAAIEAEKPSHLTMLDWLGILLWTAGFLFEAVSDWQLARFRDDPRNGGRLMDRGLWKYSRHPNYFGDALVWWGLWCFAAATGQTWTVVGPLLMTWLLLRVSGVRMLERRLRQSKPGYEEYVRRTSAFIPFKPGRSSS